jgi:ParB family chromosome partitioning protein
MSRNQGSAERRKLSNIGLFKDEVDGQQIPSCLPLEKIILPSSQPRRYFAPEAMNTLVQSIKKEGMLTPLLLRPLGDKYELVAGERRYRAALELGLTEVPVTIKILTDEQALSLALIENLQREDLNPIEETEGILHLLKLRLNTNQDVVISLFNQMANTKRELTDNVVRREEQQIIEEVFESVARLTPESFRVHRLPLLKLPDEILEALRQGQIEYTKAKAIAKVKDEEKRRELLEIAIRENLSLREIRERIKALTAAPLPSPKTEIQDLARRLNKSKLWEKDCKKWKKIQGWLDKIEALLEPEQEEEDKGIKVISEREDPKKVKIEKV